MLAPGDALLFSIACSAADDADDLRAEGERPEPLATYTRSVSVIVLPPTAATVRTLGVPIREADVHSGVASLRETLLPLPTDAPDLVVAHELALAYGRPDIVVAAVEVARWRAWRKRGIRPCTAPLPVATALALTELGGAATVDELVEHSAVQGARPRIRRSLATLAELRWVHRRGEGLALRLEPGEALYAASGVEAKLNNWRRAVRQVQSWEGYVDAVWLAFPASYLPHVPRTSSLRRFGLIGVENGGAIVVRRPSGVRASAARHLLMEQHLYGRWLTATQRASSVERRVGATSPGRPAPRVQ